MNQSPFRQNLTREGEKFIHPAISGRIAAIRAACGLPAAAAFDHFFAAINAHLRGEWPAYEDSRRLSLFRRALDGEKITRNELIGPHIELAAVLPPGGH